MKKKRTANGFALPTVMITSVVMLIMLLTGLVTVSSANVAIRNQYYDQLAKEAAESGINFMIGCVRSNVTPPDTSTFTPQSTSCSNSAADTGKSAYVLDTSSSGGTVIKTRFTINGPATTTNGYYEFTSNGYAELYRTSNQSTPIVTVPKSVKLRIQVQSLFPTRTATGNGFVCAILSGNTWCWGQDSSSEHGDGATGGGFDPSQTVRNGGGTKTYGGTAYSRNLLSAEVDVSGGDNFACAISTNNPPSSYGGTQSSYTSNRLYCWGSQEDGRLGTNVNSTTLMTYPIPANPVWEGQGQYPVQVAAGASYGCVRTTTIATYGNLWCWGSNGYGQTGRDDQVTPKMVPARAYGTGGSTNGISVKFVTASNSTTCAITTGDNAACWGNNAFGQTGTNNGYGTGNNILRPTVVKTYPSNNNLKVTAISVASRGNDPVASSGGAHACAISDGTSGESGDRAGLIWCWGSREYGAAGNAISGTPYARANPINSVDGSSGYYADSISTSWRASCAVVRLGGSGAALSTRRVYCWGNNRNGELGINLPPSYTGTLPSGGTFDSNGSTHIPQHIYIAPTGQNNFSESDILEVTRGGISYRFCVIAGTHNYCWGRNGVGQVGDGTTAGDFTSDPLVYDDGRFYPRLSIFAEPEDSGLTY